MRIQELKKVIIFLFMFGFVSGILYVNIFAKKYIISMGIFSDYFLEQYSSSKLNTVEYVWYVIRLRTFPMILLIILTCLKYKKIVGGFCILWTGFSSGLMLTAAMLKLSIKGIVLGFAGILPHFICYVAAYIIVIIYLFTYPNIKWNGAKAISIIIFMMLGIVSECYLNPVLLDIIIQML